MGVNVNNVKACVVGLGYVGLPLAVELGKYFPTIGFDINEERIAELRIGIDKTLELTTDELAASTNLSFTSDSNGLNSQNCFFVTVPTPIDSQKKPDLTALLCAARTVGRVLKKGDYVIFESTVYPGATQDECVPVLQQESGLVFNEEFFCGYSPERINPGDKQHNIRSVVKVTSGSTPKAADIVDGIYKKIIPAGTHKAESMKIAEAAKIIENTQRDINIALINELAVLFAKLGIDTQAVLNAARTKWNFLDFQPGLVGGHCIGVDPYYLTHKAQQVDYEPKLVLAGRAVNDDMGAYVVRKLFQKMTHLNMSTSEASVLVLGFTFKENCPDYRNTKVIDISRELIQEGCTVDIFDPWLKREEVVDTYGIHLKEELKEGFYDAIIIAVPHDEFKLMGIEKIRAFGKEGSLIFDVKSIFNSIDVDLTL